MQSNNPSRTSVQEALTNIVSKRNPNASDFVQHLETELDYFIRKYEDPDFQGIYTCLNHKYYDDLRAKIALNPQMDKEDKDADLMYSVLLKTYSAFLQSKAFKELFRAPKAPRKAKTKTVQKKERELTEGEKKHVEYEAAHRNPALRQACIDKYGYQCQCCGMNFVDLYGEELGANFIEVHHLKMISTFDESTPENYLDNLVPLCSNCHSMIHHGKNGPLTLKQLREAYKGEKKVILVWKEE